MGVPEGSVLHSYCGAEALFLAKCPDEQVRAVGCGCGSEFRMHDVVLRTQEDINVTVALRGRTVLVSAAGAFDVATARLLAETLRLALSLGQDIELDAGLITFLDTDAMGVIAHAELEAAAAGCAFRIVNHGSRTRRLLHTAGLAAMLAEEPPGPQNLVLTAGLAELPRTPASRA